jgi:hypothetical protein
LYENSVIKLNNKGAKDMDPSQRGEGHANESVFGHLTRCITFDRDRFGKDVDIFERALEYTKNIGTENGALE